MSSGAGVSVMDVGADLGVSWCRGCDGGGVHVPVTGGVQGRDPVSWAQGVTAASTGWGAGIGAQLSDSASPARRSTTPVHQLFSVDSHLAR